MIKEFLSLPFSFLDTFYQKCFLVIFAGIFSIIFFNFYNPFNLTSWAFGRAGSVQLVFISLSILGMSVLAFSQFGLRSWLNLKMLSIGEFLGLIIFEFSLLIIINYFIFGDAQPDFKGLITEIMLVSKQTGLILGLTYVFALLILSLIYFKEENKQYKAEFIRAQTEEEPVRQIHLKDENDKVILSVTPSNLILFKSEANYISIYFFIGEQIKKKLIRSNLKKITADILDDRFLRVHRSYMINMEHIISINRNKRSYLLTLAALPDVPIPVSATYKTVFEEKVKIP